MAKLFLSTWTTLLKEFGRQTWFITLQHASNPPRSLKMEPPRPVRPYKSPKDNEQPLASASSYVPNYQLRAILSGHKASIASIAFSPDGTMLASAGMCAHAIHLQPVLKDSGEQARTSSSNSGMV